MSTYYVNTASTAGGDGTTNNTTGATRAFASLQEAHDNIPTGQTENVYIECCGTAADSHASLVNHLTDDDHRVYVRGNENDPAGRHPGYWSTSHYRIEDSSHSTGVYVTSNSFGHCRWNIEGIQIKHSANGDAFLALEDSSSTIYAYLIGCIIHKSGGGGSGAKWTSSNFHVYGIAYNNVIVGNPSADSGIHDDLSSDWFFAGCNLVYGFINGMYCRATTGHSSYAYNNVVFGCSSSDIGSRFDVIQYCASDDDDGSNPVSISDWDDQFYNPDYIADLDFRLAEGSDLLNAGAGSSVGGVPTSDIVNVTRSTSAASVGPFEEIACNNNALVTSSFGQIWQTKCSPYEHRIKYSLRLSDNQGETGAVGETGPRGDTGVQGATGLRGHQGLTGAQGVIGVSPDAVTGQSGVTGFSGSTGARGLAGELPAVQGIFTWNLGDIGGLVPTGPSSAIQLPFDTEIDSWQVVSTETGTLVTELQKSSYADWVSMTTMNIGETGPHIINQIKNEDNTLSWAGVTGAYGDYLRLNVLESDVIRAAVAFKFTEVR